MKLVENPYPARPEKNLDHWELYRRVIDLRAAGKSLREIGQELGMSTESACDIVGKAAAWCRDNLKATTTELFHVHHARIEKLYKLVQDRIDRMDENVFDDRPFRVALLILDRQSKLFGLDVKPATGGTKKRNNWLENAAPVELIAAAEAEGIRVPPAWKKQFTLEDARGPSDEG